MKYLEITLMRLSKDFCPLIYRTAFRKMEEDRKKWRDKSNLWLNRLKILQISKLSKLIYSFHKIAAKMLTCSVEITIDTILMEMIKEKLS